MKKSILFTALVAVLTLSLTSCRKSSKGDDLPDTSSSETATYINYIKDKITFSETAMNAADIEDQSKPHYEVKLPTDIEAAKRLNVMDAKAYDSSKDTVYARYGVLEDSWGDDQINECINILVKDETLGFFKNVSTEVVPASDYLTSTNKDSRRLAVIYVPVMFNYVGNSDIDDDVYSYVFAPVYATLTTLTSDTLADSTAQTYNKTESLIVFND